MRRNSLRLLAYVVLFFTSTCSPDSFAGFSEIFSSNDAINIQEIKNPGANKLAAKNAVTIRVRKYVDSRAGLPLKNIGISTERIFGISGKDLVLDLEVAELVTRTVKKRFEDAGYQLTDDDSALYELTGVVKELTYNVKARDKISIAIETTLKELATGKTVWSGIVEEKDDRFAGVSGNSKSDIAHFLMIKLGVVTKKTYDALSATLISLRPDLFNALPGTKPIAGVTVLFTPSAEQAVSSVVPGMSVMAPPKMGVLVLSTKPDRAKVYLGGVYFGLSPLRVEIDAGVHSVDVKLDGYKTASEKVSVRKDDTTELELVLER
jgi:hypothetical protein